MAKAISFLNMRAYAFAADSCAAIKSSSSSFWRWSSASGTGAVGPACCIASICCSRSCMKRYPNIPATAPTAIPIQKSPFENMKSLHSIISDNQYHPKKNDINYHSFCQVFTIIFENFLHCHYSKSHKVKSSIFANQIAKTPCSARLAALRKILGYNLYTVGKAALPALHSHIPSSSRCKKNFCHYTG